MRLFERLEDLTDAEYHWEPVSDCIGIRPGDDGVFRVATLFPESSPEGVDPLTTIAWRIWHIGNLCLRGYVIHFFEDVPEFGDRHEWPGTAKEGVQAQAASEPRVRTAPIFVSAWSRTWSGVRRRGTSGSPSGSGSPSCPGP
ncbi:DinB family protein [Nonomuraea sp. NPDC002799]